MSIFDCLDPVTRRDGIDAATTAARGGRLVVMPTDTVYGIGADAFNAAAVRDLLAAKGRGPDMPVPVLIGSLATLSGLVMAVPPRAQLLIEAFWPGGLSLIVEHAPSLAWNLGDTRNTVMVRMPLHPIALELLRNVGPMAVSSANITGMPPATNAELARGQLGDRVGVYLDAGASPVGVASTVVDLTGEFPVLRREGAISFDRLREVLPEIQRPEPDDEEAPPPMRFSRLPADFESDDESDLESDDQSDDQSDVDDVADGHQEFDGDREFDDARELDTARGDEDEDETPRSRMPPGFELG